MSNLARLWPRLHQMAEVLVTLLLASMFGSFLIQIVFRYFLNLPLGWTVEYVTIAWLWGILFGYAFVLRDDEIIRLDIVYSAVPSLVQRGMDLVSNLVVAGILVWSLPAIYDYVTFMKVEKTAFLHIRFDVLFAIYIPFVIAIVLRNLRAAWRAVTGKTYGQAKIQTAETADHV